MFRQPFIEGWDFVSILGEGAFGQVKLMMNIKDNNNLVAVKIIELRKVSDFKTIQKEICIHKSLDHQRIVKFFGYRKELEEFYVFMEYVQNGELYNFIEPGTPMNDSDSFRFFSQLLEGVEYLHSMGIVHRDLKLENILIDSNDNLKITDFGLSTMFRHQGKERLLDRVCGSLPYVAPEMISGLKHKAEPVDIWACGVILFIMFRGEMPWDVATERSSKYIKWANGNYPSSSWETLSLTQLDILRRMLDIRPDRRATINEIRVTKWFILTKKIFGRKVFSQECHQTRICSSQQEDLYWLNTNSERINMPQNMYLSHAALFSQPIQTEYMVSTQGSTPMDYNTGFSEQIFAKITKRTSRFIIQNLDLTETVQKIGMALEAVSCKWKIITQKCITVSKLDSRNQQVNFKIHIFCPPNGKILVDFRLSNGDGLEFKIMMNLIKKNLITLIPELA